MKKEYYNRILTCIILMLFIALSAHSQTFNPTNMNFEFDIIRKDSLPTGWNLTEKMRKRGYNAKASTVSHSGKYSLLFSCDSITQGVKETSGIVHQSISAGAYIGKEVKFSAYCKTNITDKTTNRRIWIKVYKTSIDYESYISPDIIENQPDEWKKYEVEAFIPDNTLKIEYGVLLDGVGSIWLDDAEFGISGEAEYSSIALSTPQIRDLLAYSKFVSPFLFYFPDSRLSKMDLRTLTEYGVDKILENTGDITAKIKNAFPFAENNLKFSGKNINEKFYNFDNVNCSDTVFPGFRLYKGMYNLQPRSLYESKIQNWNKNFRNFPALLIQSLSVLNYVNKEFKFTVFTKNSLIGAQSKSFAAISFLDTNKKVISIIVPEPKPVADKTDWQELSINGKIPANCMLADVNLFLDGEGKALFDDASFIIDGKELISNGDFEQFSKDWSFDEKGEDSGYRLLKNIADKRSGYASLEMNVLGEEYISYPRINDVYSVNIDKKTKAVFPKVGLFKLSDTANIDISTGKTYQLFNNSSARIACVIYMWAFLDNFSSIKTKDYDTKYESVLSEGIKNAAKCSNNEELLRILQKVASLFPDNALRVWYNEQLSAKPAALPIMLKYIDNQLYVSNSSLHEIVKGSRIVKINSKSIKDYYDNEKNYISSSSEDLINARITVSLMYNFSEKPDTFSIDNGTGIKDYILRKSQDNIYLFNRQFPVDTSFGDGIYYLNLTEYSEENLLKFFKSNSQLVRGLILDLRGYTAISEFFFKYFKNSMFSNVIWKIPYYSEYNQIPQAFANYIQKVSGNDKLSDVKIIVLCDERTIGLAESHLHLLRRNNLGKAVGTPSSGAATEPQVVPLPCEFSISVSGVFATDAKGKNLIGHPFIPDEIIKITEEDIKNSKDSVILQSIKMLKEMLNK